jgi:3',5'-cyclic AMP phosphodiesterase CpdA
VTVRFLHLTDPHLSSLAGVSPWALSGKRALGFLSWWSKRRHHLNAATLARVTHAAGSEGAQMALVTGDLVHIGLPQELRQACAWLDTLAATQPVVLVPGNHDCYRADAAQGIAQQWSRYLHGDGGTLNFPRRVTCGELSIIALSSAHPMPWWSAGGRLGPAQLVALERVLAESAGSFRCVMLHHAPLVEQAPARKALADAPQLTALLRRAKVELVLHGHLHHNAMHVLDERTRVVVTAPASSAVASNPASYRVFEITRAGDFWQVLCTLKCEQLDGAMAVHSAESWSIPIALV